MHLYTLVRKSDVVSGVRHRQLDMLCLNFRQAISADVCNDTCARYLFKTYSIVSQARISYTEINCLRDTMEAWSPL